MKRNVGGLDRRVRIVLGIVLLIVSLLAPVAMFWRSVALVIAAIALATAFLRFCPVNAVLGFDSSKDEK